MGDLVERAFNIPVVVDLVVSGVFTGGLFWFFGDWGTITQDAAKGALKSVIGDTFLGNKVDYNAKLPTNGEEWSNSLRDNTRTLLGIQEKAQGGFRAVS